MIRFILTTDAQRKLRRIRRNIQQAEQRFNNAILGRKGRIANRALAKLTTEPGSPIYPLRWKTERQRRAFFATRGFGRGIPTQRSDNLLDAWEVLYSGTRDGGTLTLTNPTPYMPFVQGIFAQPFHLDTGWVQVEDVIDDFYKEVGDTVVDIWLNVADPLEGVA